MELTTTGRISKQRRVLSRIHFITQDFWISGDGGEWHRPFFEGEKYADSIHIRLLPEKVDAH